jgi:hypothetical protein
MVHIQVDLSTIDENTLLFSSILPIVLEREFWPCVIRKFMFFNKLSHNSIKTIIGKYLFDYKDNIIDKLFLYRMDKNNLDEITDYKYINRKKGENTSRKYSISVGLNLYFDLYGYDKINDYQLRNILRVECNYNHMCNMVNALSSEQQDSLVYWIIINYPHRIGLFKGLDPMKLYDHDGEKLTLFEIAHKTGVDYSICFILFYSGVNKSPIGKLYKHIYYWCPSA